jgi:hypothetical protein
MTKRLIVKLLALTVFVLFSVKAQAATQPGTVLADPLGVGPSIFAQNLTYQGVQKCLIESSTPTLVGVPCAVGAGVVYGISNSSGVAGDFAIAWDTTTAGIPAATGVGIDKNGIRLSPKVFAGTTVTDCTDPALCGQWHPVFGPVRFNLGLSAVRSGTSNAIIYYRLDTTTP